MRDTPNGAWPAQIVPHCISTLSTPCHCERIDMSHRLIHTLPETTHGAGRVEILHISKEKISPTTNAQVRDYLGKNVADETHAIFGPRAHLCEVAATPIIDYRNPP